MPDNQSVEIARLSYKQAVVVAVIACLGGIVSTLIGSGMFQRHHAPTMPTIEAHPTSSASVAPAAPRDVTTSKSSDESRTAQRDYAVSNVTIQRLQRSLNDANEELKLTKSREGEMASEIAKLQKARDDLQDAANTPPTVAMWFRTGRLPENVCMRHAEDAFGRTGVNNVVRGGDNGFSGVVGSTRICVQCGTVELIVAVSEDSNATLVWRDKIRDAFLAEGN
jgi:hypothetical protein